MILNNESKLSCQIEILKQRTRETYSKRMFSQRKEIFQRVFSEDPSESQVVRKAKALAAFLREKDILLYQDDLLAGYEQYYDYSMPAINRTIQANSHNEEKAAEAELVKQVGKGYRVGVFQGGLGGHVIAGYGRVLRLGFRNLTDTAKRKLQEGDPATVDFARASLIVSEAATDYILRYAEKAQELIQEAATEDYQKQLKRIAEACQWIAVNPARSFLEAVQLLWLTHEIITCEQSSGSMSLGRVDQYLFPYYADDISRDILTPDEASETIEALWVKFNGMKKGFQHVVLGGRGSDGKYAANEITYMCLRATKKLRMDQPLISVRWDRSMPEEFWSEIQELIQTGMGFPALFNDEVAIAAKRRMGVSNEDAENYAVVGCVELSIPGKEFSHTEELRIGWAKVLDLMLNNGVCSVTGETVELNSKRDIENISSFEEFYQWYKEELCYFTDLGIRRMNISDRDFPNRCPYPFLSSTMEGCIEMGRYVTAGSTIYNFSSINGCGMANAVNSLTAIKQVVFQEKKMPLSELVKNPLQKELPKCPKYGNDDGEPDGLLRDLVEVFCRQVESHSNPRGGSFQTGLYTVWRHVDMGKLTGDLPGGHRRGLPLASSLSPSQGTDMSGPTAVIKSITKLNHRLLGNGMVLDLKFSPSFFADEKSRQAFKSIVETYFQLGGMEIQFNVISRKTLVDAQRAPVEYRDLIVRVSGFSAYFADLDKATQDEIIARTEHTAI